MISLRKIRQQLPWIDILTKNTGGWGYIPSYNPPIPANTAALGAGSNPFAAGALSAQENFRGILGNRDRFCRPGIRAELPKDRWIFAEMLLERVDTILIAWMI